MMMKLSGLVSASALLLAATPATAQEGRPPPPPRISAALAQEAAAAAIAQCNSEGLNVSAAVVDAGGNPVYVIVPDGVRNLTGDIAIRKGITMSITGRAASETVGLLESDPEMKAKIEANPRFIRYPGGVPIMQGGELAGAIAVSGATGAQDEACAKVGLESIADRLQ